MAPVVETCDDGNVLACGTCGEFCQKQQVPSAARGQIAAISARHISEGEVFSISDGRVRLFFEFDKTEMVSASHVRIDVDSEEARNDAGAVATIMAERIKDRSSENATDDKLYIEVLPPTDGGTVVNLVHRAIGSHGNQVIIESVRNDGFQVTGMSGGAGHDCPHGTGCTVDADCAGDGHDGIGNCVGYNPDAGIAGECAAPDDFN